LDVHPRSVVACGLDGQAAELFERRLTPDHGDVVAWVRSLPGPIGVTYEAGPTGFGLAIFLAAEGIGCLVAAPSKLQRPAGDRVKTDVRDARHLARLLHLGEIVAVTVPSADRKPPVTWFGPGRTSVGDLMSALHHAPLTNRPPYQSLRDGRARRGSWLDYQNMYLGADSSTSEDSVARVRGN